MNVALIDAGPMIALFDKTSAAHKYYSEELNNNWMLTTTWACVVEACHFLESRKKQLFLRWLAAGSVTVFPFDTTHLADMAQLMEKYTQWPKTEMDLADASLVWLATETQVTRIMTMDIRDFSRYRLPDGRGFEVV